MINYQQIYDTFKQDFPFILGPCVFESPDHCFMMCQALTKIMDGRRWVFKTSFDKANRTSAGSYRGPSFKTFYETIAALKKQFPDLLFTTDVHETHQIGLLEDIVDVFQIPAFLCRQTTLVTEAAKTGKIVNIKKGQFISLSEIDRLFEKVAHVNSKVMITERGTTFGYNNLVVDMRSFATMKHKHDYVSIFDATHSVQLPGAGDGCSLGQREFVMPLALAAVAAGAQGIFMEVHDEPDSAPCDGPNMVFLDALHRYIEKIDTVREALG